MAELRATAAQLLAASVREGDDATVTRRREAAAAFGAPLVSMAELLSDEHARGAERAKPYVSPFRRRRLRECAHELVALAQNGQRSLVVTPNAGLVANSLHSALKARLPVEGDDKPGSVECLALVQIRQCRDLYEVLRVLAAVDTQITKHGPAIDAVVTGPLAMWLTPFQTASGPTVDGEGLLRALELALKRLHETAGAPILTLELQEEELEASVASSLLLGGETSFH